MRDVHCCRGGDVGALDRCQTTCVGAWDIRIAKERDALKSRKYLFEDSQLPNGKLGIVVGDPCHISSRTYKRDGEAKSDWVGTEGGSPAQMGGHGYFFVGIHGHLNDQGEVCSLGLITVLKPKE
jgi:hypothetical protein